MKNILACATSCFGKIINLTNIIEEISKIGVKGLEIMAIPYWFEHIDPSNINEEKIILLKEKLKEADLTIVALSGHSELGEKCGAEQFLERIELAAKLGVKVVSTGSGNIRNELQQENFKIALKESANLAKRLNVSIALENGGNYIPNGEKTEKLLRDLDLPNLGVNYDPANAMSWSKVNSLEDIKIVLPRLLHFHVKDFKPGTKWYPPIGDGVIDFDSLFILLKEIDYEGHFTIEIDNDENDMNIALERITKSLKYLKEKTNFFDLFPQN